MTCGHASQITKRSGFTRAVLCTTCGTWLLERIDAEHQGNGAEEYRAAITRIAACFPEWDDPAALYGLAAVLG